MEQCTEPMAINTSWKLEVAVLLLLKPEYKEVGLEPKAIRFGGASHWSI